MHSPLARGSMATGHSFLPPSTSSNDYCTLRGYRAIGSGKLKEAPKEMSIRVKSKLGAEFRRFCITFAAGIVPTFEDFAARVYALHQMDYTQQEGVTIEYVDASDGSHLPINNDDTLRVAMNLYRLSVLKIFLQRRGESTEQTVGYGIPKAVLRHSKKRPTISGPQDFRRVSAIVDADLLPVSLRRVQLCKYKTNLPLGFYIKEGTSYRNGYAQMGIFISRLVDNGLAASTNLLHSNDEILEVNGIDVTGKTLDQMTDIMIANSYHLILTLRPSEPHHFTIPPPGYGSPKGRFESGLRVYNDLPPYGTLSSRGSSGENASPSPVQSYGPMPPAYPATPGITYGAYHPLHEHSPLTPAGLHPITPSYYTTHVNHAYVYGTPASFSRNTTVRLSDKLRHEKKVPSPAEMQRLRRPFSLYAPNL